VVCVYGHHPTVAAAVNRCCVVCSWDLQIGHIGEGWHPGSSLYKYDGSKGDFPARSWANVLLVPRGRVSLRCDDNGNVFVSLCRCCALVSRMHPVAMRKALFYLDCSFCKLVADTTVDQIVLAYSTMGRTIALYVARIVSFVFPSWSRLVLWGF